MQKINVIVVFLCYRKMSLILRMFYSFNFYKNKLKLRIFSSNLQLFNLKTIIKRLSS
jgi:hypothetical protein